jgi:nucleoside-diphosphate-sugar epimerase
LKNNPNRVLVIGASGNLGKPLVRKCQFTFANVISATSKDIKTILRENKDIDLIINVANRYYPEPTSIQLREMEESIIGLAELIASSTELNRAPIIHFSTYFQYPPEELKLWSEYSGFKNAATSIYKNISSTFGIPTTEIVLYDNFGGRRKNKIFDLMLSAAIGQETIDATPGDSQLNLTHIDDIVDGVVSSAQELFQTESELSRKYQLKNSNSYSLREIDTLISITLEIQTKVNWGALKYRKKEVFEIWDCAEIPTFWSTKKSLEQYILEERKKGT